MEFKNAGPNKRVCAFLIDSFVGMLLGIMLLLLGFAPFDFLIYASYILFKDVFGGRSLGRRMVHIAVVDINGNPPSVKSTLTRNFFMVVPFFALIEYFAMLKDKQGRRIGDKAAKTRVCDLNPQVEDAKYFLVSILAVPVFFVVVAGIFYMMVLKMFQ